jgi:SAM-dependent methyltransferase
MTDAGTDAVWTEGMDLSGIDLTRPSVARVYDYYLGGFHNFPVDRDLAEATIAVAPEARAVARAGRDFLTRAVTHLAADRGVRQFLDLGSGIPTAGNVHEIAQGIDPTARVVYTDIDPIAVAHSEMILDGNPNAVCVQADLRDPGHLLSLPAVRDLLDPAEPTAVLLSLVLHFIPDDDDPAALLRHYRDALGPGSWLTLAHSTGEFQPEAMRTAVTLYRRTATPVRIRTRDEIEALLDGYQLIAPGLTLVTQWRPGQVARVPDPERVGVWAGIARAR